jgi:hypothetical protein
MFLGDQQKKKCEHLFTFIYESNKTKYSTREEGRFRSLELQFTQFA